MAERLRAANTASGGCVGRGARGGSGRPHLGDRAGAGGGRQQGRVLAEHGRLEGLQLRARVDAQLVAQALLGLGVRRQRVDLPARAIEGQHQLPAEPLVKGVGSDQLLQPPHHLAVLAEGEGGGHGGLLRDHAELREPGDGDVGEVRRSEVHQHVAAPEGEGFAQQRGGVAGVAEPERLLAAVHQAGEDLGVEVARIQGQPVPTGRVPSASPAPAAASTRRTAPTWVRSVVAAPSEGDSPHNAVTRYSLLSGRLGLSSSNASSSRARGPPNGTGRPSPSVTWRGPRRPKRGAQGPGGRSVLRPCRSA